MKKKTDGEARLKNLAEKVKITEGEEEKPKKLLNVPEDAKIYLLDTNVYLHAFESLERLIRGNVVLMPMTVLEEIDNNKEGIGETFSNARHISRLVDEWGTVGDLRMGVQTEFGGMFILDANGNNPSKLPSGMNPNKNDSKIILTGMVWQEKYPEYPLVIVSKDVNVRTKARFCGLQAEDYRADKSADSFNDLYTGVGVIQTAKNVVDRLYKDNQIPLSEIDSEGENDFTPNKFFIVKASENGKSSALTRVIKGDLVLFKKDLFSALGIYPRNSEQAFAMNLLLDPDLEFVTLSGVAGTGKTLLAVAAGLRAVLEQKKYERALMSRPIFPLGKDIGYLPGDKEEKLSHWVEPFIDNISYLLSLSDGFSGRKKRSNLRGAVDQFLKKDVGEGGDIVKIMTAAKIIEMGAITYLRGRSIPNQYIIIDEAQNLTPHQAKTIISRAGSGTKMVFTGDPHQIDNPYVDSMSNGLTYATERFKGQSFFGHVTLIKSERSNLASAAAELL